MRSWILGVARSGVVLGLAIGTCSVAWGGGSYEMLVNPSFDQLLSGSTTDPMGWISNEGFVPAVGGCCSDQGDSKPGVSNGNLNFGNSSTVVVSQEVSLSAVVPQTSEFYLSYGVQKNQQDGQYWVLVEFLDASGSSVANLRYPDSGTAVAPSTATVQSLSLGRSESARFGEINKVRVSLFGKQTSYIWYGHYGPAFSSVSLVASQVPPVGVTGLVATGGNASVTLSWAAPPTTSTVPSDYVIDYSADGGTSWVTWEDGVSMATSATVSGLVNGTTYRFRVSAKNDMGTSAPSVVATAKPSSPPQWSSQVWKELYATTTPVRSGSAIVYALDDSQTLAGFSFQQVRYRMEAKVNNTLQYVNATFDAWSGLTVGELRFPAVTVTPIQRNVSNLSVESTVSGVSTGSGMTGRLEIWPNDYSPTAVAPASTSGSSVVYDLDDTMSSGGAYGSFQVHNLTSKKTVFAWNNHGNANPDIGFGNNPYSQNTDWTFYGSNYGLDRSSWRLSVFIGIDGIPDSWTVTEDVASNLTFYGTPLSDAENDTLTATLSVPDGTLSAAAPASSVVTVSSSTTASGSSVILTGKAADLNAYLTTLGSLKYQPPQNATQSRTATLSVSDGTLSVSKNVTLQITAVNDAPSLAAISVSGTEDTTLTFTAANFTGAYSDPESPVLSSITVVTPPATGVLKLSGTAVTAGQIIPAVTLANLTYVPAAHENGAKTFTVTASDGDLSSSVSTVTMNLVAVNDAPVANTQSVTVTEDVAKVITLTGTDVEGSALTYTIESQPTKGVLSGTAPNLTYTPNANANGSDLFTFKVRDGALDSETATVTITITSVNDAPTISSTGFQLLYETVTPSRNASGAIVYTSGYGTGNSDAAALFTATGQPINRIRYRMELTVSGTPRYAEATFDGWAGVQAADLRIPDDTAANKFALQRDVSNLSVESNYQTVGNGSSFNGRLEIWPYNYAPQVNSSLQGGSSSTYDFNDIYGVNDDGHGSFQVHNVTRSETVFGWNMHRDGGPPEIGFGNNPDSSPDWTGNTLGSSGWKLQISVDSSSVPSSFTLVEDVSGNLALYGAPFADVDGDVLTVTLAVPDGVLSAAAGTGVEISGTDLAKSFKGTVAHLNSYFTTLGKVTYQAPANANGNRSLTTTVSDGTLSTSSTSVLAVDPVNDAPSLSAISVNGTEDTTLTFPLSGFPGAYSDPEDTALSSITVVTLPSPGTLLLSGIPVTAGQVISSATLANLTYVPAAHENGAKTFTVTASDGALSSPVSTVTLNLAPVDDAPVANAQSVSATEDTAQAITLTGIDPDGSALTYTIASQPAKGALSGTAPNLTYTPNAHANGVDSFTFTVSDGMTVSAVATVSLTVTSVNDAPILTVMNPLSGGVEDTDYTITYAALAAAADESDVDSATVSFRIEGVTSGALTLNGTAVVPGSTLLAAGESLSWRPALNANGLLGAFTVRAWDGQAASATALPVTVSVAAVADEVSVEGFTAVSKVYDGTRVASVSGTPRLVGLPSGVDVQIQGTPVFTLAQATVGTAVAIQVSGLTLVGAQAADYTMVPPQLVASITPKPISIEGLTGVTKVYDGTTAATVSGTAVLSGVVSGDEGQVTLSGTPVFALASAHVGTGIAISTSGYTLSGSRAGNYSLSPPTMSATITTDGLVGSQLIAFSQSSLSIPVNQQVTINQSSQLPSGAIVERVVFSFEYATYWSPSWSAVAGNYVKLNGVDLPELGWTSVGTGNAWNAETRTYLGTLPAFNRSGANVWLIGSAWNPVSLRNATMTLYYWLPGKLSQTLAFDPLADVTYGVQDIPLTASASSGLSVDWEVASGPGQLVGSSLKVLGAGSIVVRATQAGDSVWYAAPPVERTLVVGKKALSVTSPTVVTKAYDGTVSATINGTLSGVLTGDGVTLVGTGTFAGKNAGVDQGVTSTSTLSGAAAGNYTLTQPTGLKGTIMPKALSIGAPTIASKVYDGTTTAGMVTVGALSGLVGSETLTVTGTAAPYGSAAVGTYPSVVVTYTLANGGSGNTAGLAANYSLAAGTASGTITAKDLVIAVDPASLVQDFDGNPRTVLWTTTPAGIPVSVLYNGSTSPPKIAGSYPVTLTSADPNYSARLTVTLVIRKTLQGITLNAAVVAAGLQTVADASGRFLLQATLGQPIAGTSTGATGMRLDSGFWFTEQFSAALEGRTLVGLKSESKIRGADLLRSPSVEVPGSPTIGPEIDQPVTGKQPLPRLVVMPMTASGEVWIRISGVPADRWLIQYQDRLHSDQWFDESPVELDADGAGAVRASTGVGEMRFYRLVQP